MPVFSIIIPVYNSSKTIESCLSSVLNQKFRDFEIIIIDDGSTDNSFQICENFQKKDPRIKLIRHRNSGPGFSRNAGIDKSEGTYIVFLDSDDYIDDSFLSILSNKLDEQDDITFFGYVLEDEFGNRLIKKEQNPENKNFEKLIYWLIKNDTFGYTWCKVIKRSFLEKHSIKFNVDYSMHEDLCFISDCLHFTKNINFINFASYHYIKRPGSLCAIYQKSFVKNIEHVNFIYFGMLEFCNVERIKELEIERAAFCLFLVLKNEKLAKKDRMNRNEIKSFLNGPTISKMNVRKKVFSQYVKGKKSIFFYLLVKTKSVMLFRILLKAITVNI